MQTIDTVLAETTAQLEARGASPDDARAMAERYRDRLSVAGDGTICIRMADGAIRRTPSDRPADFLAPMIAGGAPSGVFSRPRPSDEVTAAKGRTYRRMF